MTSARSLCDRLGEDEMELLREDPFEAIPLIDPAVRIHLVSHDPGEGCSVEGMYHEPTRFITVQRATSGRRTRFTAIHEFGHDRARHDIDVARILASMSQDISRRAEERIADAFAAAVLIPDYVVDEILDGNRPTARDLVSLFHHDEVAGSREACCVRIAQRMNGDGYVVLAEGGVLRFCATVGAAYSIRRGSDQSQVGIFRGAMVNGSATDPITRLQFPDSRFTGEYAGQAVSDGLYVFAVLTDSTTPPWGGWIAPRRVEGDAPEIFCAECDEVTEAWERCDTDRSHRVCGQCGWCACRAPRFRMPEKFCDTCTQRKRVDLFPSAGPTCRDCL